MKFSDPPMELRDSVPCLESGCEIPTYTVDTAKVQGVDGPFEPRIDLQSWAKILPRGEFSLMGRRRNGRDVGGQGKTDFPG